MTPEAFKAWRIALYGERGVSAAAKALGCSRTSILAWEQEEPPLYIELACCELTRREAGARWEDTKRIIEDFRAWLGPEIRP